MYNILYIFDLPQSSQMLLGEVLSPHPHMTC